MPPPPPASAPSALSELHPSPAIVRSLAHVPAFEQQPGSEKPMIVWLGHEGSGFPGDVSRHPPSIGPAAPAAPIPRADRSIIAPHPLLGRQQAPVGTIPPVGALQVMLPHMTIDGGGLADAASFNSMIGTVATASVAPASVSPAALLSGTFAAGEPLLLLQPATAHACASTPKKINF